MATTGKAGVIVDQSEAEELGTAALKAARSHGARQLTVRLVTTITEYTEATSAVDWRTWRTVDTQIGIRVVAGAWVGSVTGPVTCADDARDAAERACALAGNVDQAWPAAKVAVVTPAKTERAYRSAREIDPFQLSAAERAEPLRAAASAALATPGCRKATARAEAYSRVSWLFTGEGSRYFSESVQTGAWIETIAEGAARTGRRSFPQREGRHASGGWEHVLGLDLAAHAPEAAREAVLVTKARPCPSGYSPVVIDPAQMTLQVHESIGHPLELDRILGWELDYAGGSFVRLTDIGSLAYGSTALSVIADPLDATGVGSMPWDDDGAAVQAVPLIDRGLLVGTIDSGGAAASAGRPLAGGSARSQGAALPLARMSNINMLAGQGSLPDLLSEMDNGIYMCGNRAFSIDADRDRFEFGCEIGWQVRHGELCEPLCGVGYRGRTLDFWDSCQQVAGDEEYVMNSVTFCAKGSPVQIARVGHGVAPALFTRVECEAMW